MFLDSVDNDLGDAYVLPTYPVDFVAKTCFFSAAGLGAVFALAKYEVSTAESIGYG